MDLLGSIARNLAWPLNEYREDTRILSELKKLTASQYLDKDSFQGLRLDKLHSLLQHAYEHCPFYRERFDKARVKPDHIRNFDDLVFIPPLTKDDLVLQADNLRAENISDDMVHRSATGGSTGRHTPFYRDNDSLNRKEAARFRYMNWTGWRVGDRAVQFWPAIQDIRQSPTLKQRLREMLIGRCKMMYAGQLNETVMTRHADILEKFDPILIRAFPNPLSLFAQHISKLGRSITRPKGIITVGEPLLSSQRQLFQQVFGCPVFDCYVSRECGHLAGECENHAGLHINADCVHLEFVDENYRPVPYGQVGKILITDFVNFGMPFIRYEIGDLGIPLQDLCVCGRILPLMEMHAGRISDFVISPQDDSLISGATLCHHLLVEGPNVGQLQIIQDQKDHLTIRICNQNAGADNRLNESKAAETLDRLFAGKMRIKWEHVDSIPHEKSGKYRFCINNYSEKSES